MKSGHGISDEYNEKPATAIEGRIHCGGESDKKTDPCNVHEHELDRKIRGRRPTPKINAMKCNDNQGTARIEAARYQRTPFWQQ